MAKYNIQPKKEKIARYQSMLSEETILNAAYTYEQATNFRSKYRPNI